VGVAAEEGRIEHRACFQFPREIVLFPHYGIVLFHTLVAVAIVVAAYWIVTEGLDWVARAKVLPRRLAGIELDFWTEGDPMEATA
jgi:hypothetical protein